MEQCNHSLSGTLHPFYLAFLQAMSNEFNPSALLIVFLWSALLRNCFLCWDGWKVDVMPTLDAALLCSSRAGFDLGCESGVVTGFQLNAKRTLYLQATTAGLEMSWQLKIFNARIRTRDHPLRLRHSLRSNPLCYGASILN